MKGFMNLGKCLVLLILLGLAISACNTVHGAGEDLEKAGDKIEHAAD